MAPGEREEKKVINLKSIISPKKCKFKNCARARTQQNILFITKKPNINFVKLSLICWKHRFINLIRINKIDDKTRSLLNTSAFYFELSFK